MTELELTTHCAHWGYDDHRYFGHKVFEELLGRETLTGLTVLSVLGRRLPKKELAIIDDLAVALSMADPRIWPLKLTRVLASYGGTVTAVAGGLMILEDARIGPWPAEQAARMLLHFHDELAGHERDPKRIRSSVERYLVEHPLVPGFGTPLRRKDERLVAFRGSVQFRERDSLPFWRLMTDLCPVITELTHAQPNMASGLAACFLDLGLAIDEIVPLTLSLMEHMFLANAIEGAREAPALLRLLPEAAVNFVGRAPRLSARAAAVGA